MGFSSRFKLPRLDNRINSRAPEDGYDRYERYSEMNAEDIFRGNGYIMLENRQGIWQWIWQTKPTY